MIWEYDRAFLEGGKDLAIHPLYRNTFEMQNMEGLGQREVITGWIDWETEIMGFKVL